MSKSDIRRLKDDLVCTWSAMPKSQALRWYAAVLRHALTVARERKFYSADHDMRGNLRFFVLGNSVTVDVDAINSTSGNGYAFLREFFVRQIYFREFNQLHFGTSLDLGCNIGFVAALLQELAGPKGRVVGVDALTFDDNTFRAKAATTPGVTLHRGVLCGESALHDSSALHAICDRFGFDINLAITVEQLMAAYGLQHVDFVKMDIEGAEFDIFRDSAGWLDSVDNLAMEVHRSSGNPELIIDRLQQAGFRVKWLDDRGYSVEPQYAGYIYASKTGSLKD